MAKDKQPHGRKIKQSQPIALERAFRDTLEEFRVIKGPVVPKFEILDKYIVGRGWKLSLRDGHGTDAGAFASVGIPGLDGPVTYEATGETAMHAATYALCEALRKEPKQGELFDEKAKADPNGTDMPLFKGNGGVASVAEMELQSISVDELARDLDAEIRAGAVPGVSITDNGLVTDAAAIAEELLPPVREWDHLSVVEPADTVRWREAMPTFAGEAVVDWDDGKGADAKGWYLEPGFTYDPKSGEIRLKQDGEETELVWSRPTAEPAKKKGAVEATRVNLVTTTADA